MAEQTDVSTTGATGLLTHGDVVRLLHEIDGLLGLAVHRKEHRTNEVEWLADAEEYSARLRRVIPIVEGVDRMTDAEEKSIRKDERGRLALLLQDHVEVIGTFASDPLNAVKLVVYMLRLND